MTGTGRGGLRVAGFGFRKGAGVESLRAALVAAGGGPVDLLATAEGKVGGLSPLGLALGLPVRGVAVECVATVTQSDRVRARFGTGSLAEAAALAAAGRGARLVVLRVASPDGMATCAVAEGEGE